MKLYTEEEVRRAIELSDGRSEDEVLAGLTPIELPSDEEIEEACNCILVVDKYKDIWKFGAIWMRDKIQGGNK